MSWCTENLSPEQRREIAEELIAGSGCGRVMTSQNSRSELICLCPLHEESNPSFAYNWQKDIYNCSSGCDGGDLIKLFYLIQGMDPKNGFKAFLKQYAPEKLHTGKGGGKRRNGKTMPKAAPPAQNLESEAILESVWEALPPLPEEWATRLADTRGWSREVMTGLDLRLARIGKTERVAIPIRDEQGRLMNIRKYVPGAAENKVMSEKGHGQVRLWPFDACIESGSRIWLCEGEVDTICALSHGLTAITATGGAGSWRPEFNGYFNDRDVVIAYDADLAGYNGAHKVAAQLAPVAKRVRIVTWPKDMLADKAPADESHGQAQRWAQAAASATKEDPSRGYMPRLPAKHGKDLTDFQMALGHSVDELETLLGYAEEIHAMEPKSPFNLDHLELNRLYEAGNAMGRFKAVLSIDGKEAYRAPLACYEFLQNNKVIYEPKTSKIYRWNGKYWVNISEEELKGLFIELMGMAATRNRLGELMDLVKTKNCHATGSGHGPVP